MEIFAEINKMKAAVSQLTRSIMNMISTNKAPTQESRVYDKLFQPIHEKIYLTRTASIEFQNLLRNLENLEIQMQDEKDNPVALAEKQARAEQAAREEAAQRNVPTLFGYMMANQNIQDNQNIQHDQNIQDNDEDDESSEYSQYKRFINYK